MKRPYLLLPFCAVFALAVLGANAQDYVYATGNPNFGVNYPVPNGSVNVTNGNVHLSIPLGTFQQRGKLPPVQVNLEYDSRIWQIVDNGGSYSWQPTNVPNSMAGWRLTTGLETGALSYSNYISQYGSCGQGQEQLPTQETFTDFTWTDGSGTKHVFQAGLYQQLPIPCSPSPQPVTTSGWAIDNSGYSLTATYEPSSQSVQTTIYDNQGNEVYPQRADPNGNTATLTSDSIGRTLVTTTTTGNTIQYKVLTEGGGTNTFTITTVPISVDTSFNQSAVTEYSGTMTAIQSIQLPDGSFYNFSYNTGTTAGFYGELLGMTLPTGGAVAFGYTNYLDSYQNENRWINSESDGGGIASFSPLVLTQCSSGEVGCQEQMTVTRPDGNKRIYTLTLNDGAWDGTTDTYQGATKIMTVTNNYNFTSYQCAGTSICNGAEYIAASSSTVTLDDTGQSSKTVYTYDAPWAGRISSKQEFDYGVTATPSRETDYTYGYAVNGAPFVTQKKEMLNGNPFSQIVYNYDPSGLGNLMSEVHGLPGQSQATTSYTYDSDGMKTSEVDPNGNTTSFAYSCNDLYLSKTTYPVTGSISHITQVNPDCSSGLPVSTTDQNNLATLYGYDSLGRKGTVTYPDGGLTTYQYPSPNQTTESRLVASGTTNTTTTTLDSFGRKSTVSQSDPAGADTVTTTYDGDNRVACVTSPERTTESTTDGQTCYSYDTLDRPTLITQPDGHTIQISYNGNQAKVTDEDTNLKSYAYDAFHDLTSVMEPNATGTLAWQTTYAYDADGHLLTVVQNGDGSSAPRDRTFTYDDLGRLTQELIPEAGSKAYSYDNNGNVKTVTTGRGTISYNYDALNRVTSETAGAMTNSYTYDLSTNGGYQSQYPVGRLVEASNNVNASEQFSYDPMGRITYQANCIPASCSQTGNAVHATYDYVGNVISLTYPDGRVITRNFDSALHLSGVQYSSWNGQSQNSAYLSSITYAPTEDLTGAVYGNGVQMSSSYSNRDVITSLSYQSAGQTLWSKQYQWANNAKNLTRVADQINSAQTYSYTYDPDNRLTGASGGGQTLISPGTAGTGSISIEGIERTYNYSPPGCHARTCSETIYNSGSVTATVDGIAEVVSYGEGSTDTTVASALATRFNSDPNSQVSAIASGATVTLTAKTVGAGTDYSITIPSPTYDSTYFSSSSFTISSTASTLTGGANAVYSGTNSFTEAYSQDPWGNMTQSGNFTFGQGFQSNNQITSANGFSFDSAGDLLSDGMNSYTYNVDGTLASTSGTQLVYDAQQQRVQESLNGGTVDVVYFQGQPIAIYNTSTGTWTDMIMAGNQILAEVAGTESAVPIYRLLDHEGSLIATTNGSGGVVGTAIYAPYGQPISSSISDPYIFTGLSPVPEGYHAAYRDFAEAPSRWLSPDPYNGSYDPMNPQSLNRYSYVNGNPLTFTDPSGLAGAGILTGIGGAPCKVFGGSKINVPIGFDLSLNPCNPVGSAITDAITLAAAYVDASRTGSSIGGIIAGWKASAKPNIANGYDSTFSGIAASVGAAITIACSIHSDSDLCGQTSWTSALIGGDAGKVVGDSIAVAGAIACFSGPQACLGYAIYTIANDLFSLFWDLFGPPHFKGSLLPRPSDLGGLGTAPIGIPNQNLTAQQLLGSQSTNLIPSPGMVHPR